MKITENILIADENKVLTNGTDYGTTVYLGSGDSVENWYEISKKEYTEIMQAAEENVRDDDNDANTCRAC